MARPRTFAASHFEVRESTIPGAGKGLFSKVRIEIEETIGYYQGAIITVEELNNGRCSGSDYLMFISAKHIIVGEGPKANYTRYINHSSSPNAFLVVSTRWKTARFEAIRPIAPGDEIFFNYGEQYWPNLMV